MKYRCYAEVPWYRKSLANISLLILGLGFPPFLIWVVYNCLTGAVYGGGYDPAGNLRTWSRKNKFLVLLLVKAYTVWFVRWANQQLGMVRQPEMLSPVSANSALVEGVPLISGIPKCLSTLEKIRLQEISQGVIAHPGYLTPRIQTEFQTLAQKCGALSSNETEALRDALVGTNVKHQYYIYRDALLSLEMGRPYRSKERQEYENHLLKMGLMTEWRIREHGQWLDQLAQKQPVVFQGQSLVMTADLLRSEIQRQDETLRRFNLLLSTGVAADPATIPLNSSGGWARETCSSPNPGGENTWYPVYVNYSEKNLLLIQATYCRDAIRRFREELGLHSIQIAAFLSPEEAKLFAEWIKTQMGSGEVGAPYVDVQPQVEKRSSS